MLKTGAGCRSSSKFYRSKRFLGPGCGTIHWPYAHWT